MSRAVITHFVQDHRKLCEKITLKKKEKSQKENIMQENRVVRRKGLG